MPAIPIPSGLGPCATCKYWDTPGQPTSPIKKGVCRALLPILDPTTSKATWPICDETDWCKFYAALGS